MAPTAILASQHLESFESILNQFGIRCELLISSITKKKKIELLGRLQNGEIDILIGTQMVVKGHHFPNVTLVGVIAADSSLNIDDYRANERTFQILTQVAGRAGREQLEGNVIIQTYNPENFAIQCAKEQNYDKFYNTEI